MKKNLIIIGVVVLVIIIFGSACVSKYNSIIELETVVDKQSSNIDVYLERRADLIPNLVNTVKGYTAHEEAILKEISDARSNIMNARTTSDKITANNELDSTLSKLLVIVENYPDLKADKTFINLQDELAGSENRISTARRDYNDAASNYNAAIKKFPGNIIASMFKFETKEYFEASEGKTEVPTVDFN